MKNDALKEEAKLVDSVQILAGMRKVLTDMIKHATLRKAFGSELFSFDMVKNKIGLSCIHFYALESTIYMTAGLADYQTNPDYCLEATACKLLSMETTRYAMQIFSLTGLGSIFGGTEKCFGVLENLHTLHPFYPNFNIVEETFFELLS